MPTKGNPVLGCRVSRTLLARLEAQLQLSAIWRRGEQWTRATFIESAIREKLDKMARGRRPRRKKVKVGIFSPV